MSVLLDRLVFWIRPDIPPVVERCGLHVSRWSSVNSWWPSGTDPASSLGDVRSPRLRRVATHGFSIAARDWFPGGLRADAVADASPGGRVKRPPYAYRPGALHRGGGRNAHRPFVLRGIRRRIASARLSTPFGVQLADAATAALARRAHTALRLSAAHAA